MMTVRRLVFGSVADSKILLSAIAVGVAAAGAMEIAMPVVLGVAVDRAEEGDATDAVPWLLAYAGAYLAMRVVQTSTRLAYGHVEQQGQTRLHETQLRQAWSMSAVARARLSDAEVAFAAEQSAAGFRALLWSGVATVGPARVTMLFGAVSLLVVTSAPVTLAFLASGVLFAFVSYRLVPRHQGATEVMMDEGTQVFGTLERSHSLWREARLLGVEEELARRLVERRGSFERAALSTYRRMAELSVAQSVVLSAGLATMLLLAADEGASAGSIVVVAGIGLGVLLPLEGLGFALSEFVVGVSQVREFQRLVSGVRGDGTPPQVVALDGEPSISSRLCEPQTGIERRLEARPPRPVWIRGPSGAGKSTLLESAVGLSDRFEGETVVRRRSGQVLFALVSQRDVILDADALDNVTLGRNEDAKAIEVVRRLLPSMFDEDGLERRLSEASISGGEARRIMLARALVSDPAVLVCDEPTAGLDAGSGAVVWDAILAEARERAVVIATHDPHAPISATDLVIDLDVE